MIARRGPDRERMYKTTGEAKTKANRKDVLSQLITSGVVLKKVAVVLVTGA